MNTKLYDAVTLELERAECLTFHLEQHLADEATDALYALCLIARHVNEIHKEIRTNLNVMDAALRLLVTARDEEARTADALKAATKAAGDRRKTKRAA